MRGVRYTKAATGDLRRVRDWLLQKGSGEAAQRRWASIRIAIRLLGEHPMLGARHPKFSDLRSFVVERHILVYAVEMDCVRIIRVFGRGQLGDEL